VILSRFTVTVSFFFGFFVRFLEQFGCGCFFGSLSGFTVWLRFLFFFGFFVRFLEKLSPLETLDDLDVEVSPFTVAVFFCCPLFSKSCLDSKPQMPSCRGTFSNSCKARQNDATRVHVFCKHTTPRSVPRTRGPRNPGSRKPESPWVQKSVYFGGP